MFKKVAVNVFLLLLFIVCSSEAYAYVDPGTGGYLFQVLFLAFSAVAAVLAFFRSKVEAAAGNVLDFIKNLFRGSGA